MNSKTQFGLYVLVIFLSTFSLAYSQTPWLKWEPETGVVVHESRHTEWSANGVQRTDGNLAGEIGYVWTDTRNGLRGIAVQVITPEGDLKFGEIGKQVLINQSSIEGLNLTPFTDGGWFLCWKIQTVDGDVQILSAKVDSEGEPLWGADGGVEVQTVGNLLDPGMVNVTYIVDDGEGGCFIIWSEPIGMWDVETNAKHILADGELDREWGANGLCLIRGASLTGAISDGEGGIIYVYSLSLNVYLQRINGAGVPQWDDDVLACTDDSDQRMSRTCPDGDGGAFVTWYDNRNSDETGQDIYAQRIDSDGNLMWDAAGVPICTEAENQRLPNVTATAPGIAVVSWSDFTEDGHRADLYAMSITGDDQPEFLWEPAEGVPIVVVGENQEELFTCPDGEGGVYFIWQDRRDEDRDFYFDVYAQHVSFFGDIDWQENGLLLQGGSAYQGHPRIHPLSANRCIASWDDQSGGIMKVLMQCILQNGEFEFEQPGSRLVSGFAGEVEDHYVFSSGEEGFIMAWIDHSYGTAGDRPHVQIGQNLGDSVAFRFGYDGIPVIDGETRNSVNMAAESDGEGGIIMVWEDSDDNYPIGDIWAQRVSVDGEILWEAGGVQVSDYIWGEEEPAICGDGSGGAIIAWNSGDDIYAQRLDAEGNRLWGDIGSHISAREEREGSVDIAPDGEGGAVVIWRISNDRTLGDIYAQYVNAEGILIWGEDPVVLSNAEESQRWASIIRHPDGYFTCWDDQHGNIFYTQFIENDGTVRWTQNGVTLCEANNVRDNPQAVVDADGYIWVIWDQDDDDIYMQKIDPRGEEPGLLFGRNGAPVVNLNGQQRRGDVKSDGQGGIWVVWPDGRENETFSMYATHIDPDGIRYDAWEANGNQICEAPLYRREPMIALLRESGEAGIVTVWRDGRGTNEYDFYDVYCQRIDDDAFNGAPDQEKSPIPPSSFEITEVFPNPFNQSTKISYNLGGSSSVKISVFNTAGQLICEFLNSEQDAGFHTRIWNGEDNAGKPISTGLYFFQIEAGSSVQTRKLVCVR